jgi:hypothetical protein
MSRTAALERFNDTQGLGERLPCTGGLEQVPEDDMSALYWQIKERCIELGIETDVLVRLRDAEDEAIEWLAEHGRPEREYRQAMEDYQRELEAGWEERADHEDYR